MRKIRFRIRELLIEIDGIRLSRAVFGIGGAGGICAMAAFMLQSHGAHRGTVATVQARPETFSSGLGEHRNVQLPDGVVIALNTNTAVSCTYDPHRRHCEVSSGQAAFLHITQDTNRPFDVDIGGVTVGRVTGSFDAYRRGDSVQVTIIDGEAKVMPTALIGAGAESAWAAAPTYHRLQQVTFVLATKTPHTSRTLSESGLKQLLSWQRGSIDLHGLTVRQALDEFGRYQSINQFHFQSESLATMRVDGEVKTTDLMGFLTALERFYHIHYSMTAGADGNTTVTLSRHSGKGGPKEKPATESNAMAGVAQRES